MDASQKSKRLYPSYTTEQIRGWLSDPTVSLETKENAALALMQRDSSNPLFIPRHRVPQIA